MKKALFLLPLVIISLSFSIQAQSTLTFDQDTVWIKKSGLVIPCQINTDSISEEFVYIYFLNDVGEVDQTRFTWKQIDRIHQQSKPYIPLSSIYRVELNDGTVLEGKLLSKTEEYVELNLADVGNLKIMRVNIKRIIPTYYDKKKSKAYWFKNPHATRLLFAPTAIPLKQKEAYYQNIYIFGNMFNVGVLNNLSIGGGFDFITMFTPDVSPLLTFNIKTGFQISENFHLGAGGIYAGMYNEFSAGILYGMGTYGSYNTNITLGLGWGFVDGSFEANPFIMVGGMIRVAEKLWLVSENWIAPVQDPGPYYVIVSYGVRFAARRIAVDLAFINSADIIQNIPIGIPFVDFVIKLGKH